MLSSIINKYLKKKGLNYIKITDVGSYKLLFEYFIITKKNIFISYLKYIFIQLKHFKKKTVIKEINGNLMHLSMKDKGISKELLLYSIREFYTTSILTELIGSDDLVIDIGANIGYYVLLERKKVNDNQIFAIEPVPLNYTILNENLDLNRYKIKTFNLAVGSTTGKYNMYIYNKCNWCSLKKQLTVDISETIEVNVTTIDHFIDNELNGHNPTFIRMDVEGYEYNILLGAKSLLNSNHPLTICIEIHPHLLDRDELNNLIDLLYKSNFKVYAVNNEISPYNFKDIIRINNIRKKMGVPEFGNLGNDYITLKEAMKMGITCNVFFKRTSLSQN